ncbi:MAG: MerR family transcriptional regulator [Chitinophagaceae bacterium]|nr:MerR family transcriptional regulator [Chitinophagaceae bacterium]
MKQLEFDFNEFFPDPGDDKPAKKEKVRKVADKPQNPADNVEKKTVRSGRRSLKEGVSKDVVLPPDEELFKKSYYPIGQVAKMFGEQTSLIRFWENEFKMLKPRKNRKGDRHFRPEDVKMLYLINHLLRERKYTIEGAKEYLKNEKAALQKFELIASLEKLKLFLTQFKENL